jgi:hypothetical protein
MRTHGGIHIHSSDFEPKQHGLHETQAASTHKILNINRSSLNSSTCPLGTTESILLPPPLTASASKATASRSYLQYFARMTLRPTSLPRTSAVHHQRGSSQRIVKVYSSTALGRQYRSQSWKMLGERKECLVVVKIILKFFERTNDQNLRLVVKAVVSDCIRRNRMGDTNFTPLHQVVKDCLRSVVGHELYSRVHLYCERYFQQKLHSHISSV